MMGSRRLGSCCPRFALNGKSKIVSWYVPYLPPAPLTPGTQQADHWRWSFTDSAGVLLLTTLARSPPLTREAAGVSLWSFPPQFWFARPPTEACRERNVPVMLGIRLSRCKTMTIYHRSEPSLEGLTVCKRVLLLELYT